MTRRGAARRVSQPEQGDAPRLVHGDRQYAAANRAHTGIVNTNEDAIGGAGDGRSGAERVGLGY